MDVPKKAKAFLIVAGIVCMLLPALPYAVPAACAAMGAEAFCVPTGSMEPSVPAGSAAAVVPADPEGLQEGDVVAYMAQDGRTVVLHRVAEVDRAGRTIRTKGDANPVADVAPVPYGSIVGLMCWSVPHLGYMLDLASCPAGVMCRAMLFGSGLMLLVMGLSAQARKQYYF